MNESEKFMRLFGSIFLGVGVIMIIVGVTTFCVTNDLFAGGIPFIMGIIFGGVGGYIVFAQLQKGHKRNRIEAEGIRYTGKIHSYLEDKSCLMNGDFLVNIKVHYFDNQGIEREAIIPTGFPKGCGDYPIGATIDIIVLGTSCTWDKNSVRYEKIAGEEELMDDKPLAHGTMVAVSCKSCGASFSAVSGFVSKCPYCGKSVNC